MEFLLQLSDVQILRLVYNAFMNTSAANPSGLATYTFFVKDHKFEVDALSEDRAKQIANQELFGLMAQAAVPNKFSSWMYSQHFPRTFLWVANKC